MSKLLDESDLFAAINQDIDTMAGDELLASGITGVEGFMDLHYRYRLFREYFRRPSWTLSRLLSLR